MNSFLIPYEKWAWPKLSPKAILKSNFSERTNHAFMEWILSFKVKYIMNKWKNFNPIFSTTLRGLDSHGHFYTIFTSFCRRALNNDIDKCSTLKCKIIGFLHYYIVYVNSRPKLSYVRSKANLTANKICLWLDIW